MVTDELTFPVMSDLESSQAEEMVCSDSSQRLDESGNESIRAVDEVPHLVDDTQALAINARFSSWKAAKAAVIHHCFNLYHASPKASHNNNKTFKIWTCLVEGCPFRAYFVNDRAAGNIRLARLEPVHTCEPEVVPARYGTNQRAYIDLQVSMRWIME